MGYRENDFHGTEERRDWKSNYTEEGKKNYKRLHNELRRETDKAREDWWEKRCDELTEYDKRGRSDLLYYEVSKLTRTGKKLAAKSAAINDENGELISEIEEVKLRWKKYIEDLYSKSNKPKIGHLYLENECEVYSDQKGPDLLSEEIYAGIMELKDGKAVGVDDVPAEFLKMLDGRTMEKLIALCKQIYKTGIWPEDFTRTIMIPIPKKENAI